MIALSRNCVSPGINVYPKNVFYTHSAYNGRDYEGTYEMCGQANPQIEVPSPLYKAKAKVTSFTTRLN